MQGSDGRHDRFWAVTLPVPRAWAEDAGASLIAAGALGVEERPTAGAETDGAVTLLASFCDDANLEGGAALGERAAAALEELGLSVPAAAIAVASRQGRRWDEEWKRQLKPIKIGRRLWVVPTWERAGFAPPLGSIVVVLDPGAAFGSGQHATTALCLRAIEAWADARPAAARAQASMVDVGCGSGILAIAARKLGIGRVLATDIDPEAVADAGRNAALNDVHVATTGAAVGELPGTYDLVVANILAAPLRAMAADLLARTAPGGQICLAGLLGSQADEVFAAYAQAGRAAGVDLRLGARHTHAEWATLILCRA